jgi:hypothetical protein
MLASHQQFAALIATVLTKPSPDFTVPLPCFFPFCLVGTREIPHGSYKKGFKKMRRHQTEAAYLKSVLLWLQGNWTESDPPRFYPLKEVEQRSRYFSGRRMHAALNRRGEIIDLPAFLPPRNSSQYRQRKTVNQGRQNNPVKDGSVL